MKGLRVDRRPFFFQGAGQERSRRALLAARLLGLIGCNRVTCHDAVISVRAGFRGRELSSLWPEGGDWQLNEAPAGLFSHLFLASRPGGEGGRHA